MAETQTQALRDRGHDVTLISTWLGQLPESQYADPTLFRAWSPTARGRRAVFSPRLVRGLRSVVAAHDVMHVHLCRDFVTTYAVRAAARAGLPVVAQTHGMMGPAANPAMRLFDMTVARRWATAGTTYLTFGDEGRQLAAAGVKPESMHPFWNAVPEPPSSSLWRDSPGQRPHFVFCSRFQQRKRPLVVVEALRALRERGVDAELTMAGPDEGMLDAVRRYVNDHGLSDHVHLVGSLEQAGVRALLSRATAMVLASVDEPYPMIAIEAAAQGCPTIISSDTGVSSLLEQNAAAEVVIPEVDAVTEAMQVLVDDPTRRTALSTSSLAVYRSHWSTGALVSGLERVYHDALER